MEEYQIFIYILYNTLINDFIKNCTDNYLYRGGIISKCELNKLITDLNSAKNNKSDEISLLSFTKNKSVAEEFVEQNKNNLDNDSVLVRFVIEPLKKNYPNFYCY